MATQGKNNHRDNGIMDSIAALRSVLMLDTPIREALAVGKDSTNYKKQEAQKLCFSPASLTQATTPTSRNTHMNTPMSKFKISTSKRSPLFKTPTPSKLPRSPEVQQSATMVLEKKIQLLEASHAELEERLKGEIEQRQSLKTAYEKLSEFQTKQSSQLEQITASRDNFRDESVELKKTLEMERSNHSKTIAFLQSTSSTVMQSERLREKESFRTETERLKKRLQRTDSRYAESELLVKSLTKEVEKLNADLKKLRNAHKLAMEKKKERHEKEVADLQEKIEQTESGLIQQINKERKSAEENYEKLQKVQKHQAKLKEEYALEKGKMKAEMSELQGSLKKAIDERTVSEQKLEKAEDDVSQLRQQIAKDQLDRKESEGKVEKIHEAKLAADSSIPPAEGDQHTAAEGSKDLQFENTRLQQKLKLVEESRNQLQNELQETRMELDGLKQNLEEAERIEVQNEELQEQLRAYKSDTKTKDQLLRDMEMELKKVEVNSSNTDTSGSGHSVTIHKLEKELKKVKEELSESKEKLCISRVSNLNRLVEVATHRERVRDLEGDLEELEEKLNEENSITDVIDERKRGKDEEEFFTPRKRLRDRDDDENEAEIVL